MDHNIEQSYLLGELVALGQLLETSCYGTEHSSLCLEKKSAFLSFEEYFPLPLYLKKLEKLEGILDSNGKKEIMNELFLVYQGLSDKCAVEFEVMRDYFCSGYFSQLSLHD